MFQNSSDNSFSSWLCIFMEVICHNRMACMSNTQQLTWLLLEMCGNFVLKIRHKTVIAGRQNCVHLFYGVLMSLIQRYYNIIINTYSHYVAHMSEYLWTLSFKIMLTSWRDVEVLHNGVYVLCFMCSYYLLLFLIQIWHVHGKWVVFLGKILFIVFI